MKQEIDFFKSLPSRSTQLPAQWITRATLGLIILLTCISFFMAIYQIHQYYLIRKLHEQNIDITFKFNDLTKRYPLLTDSPPIRTNIALLEKQLHDKTHYYKTLARVTLRHGFYDYLSTLARVVPEGLWLQDILINLNTKGITLGGYMMRPVDMSLLLQLLQNTPVFSDVKFDLFYVKNVREKPYTEFKITNTSLESERK